MNSPHESDNGLLAAFVENGDEAAFSRLIERYRGCVLAVCCRITRNPADAQDAAQATFLVLARKAEQYRKRTDILQCLFRIARNCSLNVRRNARLRRRRESEAAGLLPDHTEPEPGSPQEVVDDLIARLPTDYRQAILMHHMQGMKLDDIASQLGVPHDTVAKRVSRGRQKLRRLARRSGIAVSVTALLAVLSEQSVVAQVPSATAAAAVLVQESGFAAATGLVNSNVIAIGAAATKTMAAGKIKAFVGVVLAMLLAAGVLGTALPAAEPSAPAHADVLFAEDFSNGLSLWRVVQSKNRAHYGVEEGHLVLRPNARQGNGWPPKGHGVYSAQAFELPLRLEADLTINKPTHDAMCIMFCLTPRQFEQEQRFMLRGDDAMFVNSPTGKRSSALVREEHGLNFPANVRVRFDLYKDGQAVGYLDGRKVCTAAFPAHESKAFVAFLVTLKSDPPPGFEITIDNVVLKRIPE